ncbi:hypothetical protein LIZ76_12920 [Caldibacillus sp. 210928-DFI.2.22]|uniref:hypothetical protein n=1 Tax=unclassified Caldibacillus TaxID=2641266 RepID=UPI001D0876F6|nr:MULTISPECIES: hypothetical protein [unclassified Caldibacillus]MCB7070868.1 hypothetical protein [Caldibacillus sp. 210928-DFI.2.22]
MATRLNIITILSWELFIFSDELLHVDIFGGKLHFLATNPFSIRQFSLFFNKYCPKEPLYWTL